MGDVRVVRKLENIGAYEGLKTVGDIGEDTFAEQVASGGVLPEAQRRLGAGDAIFQNSTAAAVCRPGPFYGEVPVFGVGDGNIIPAMQDDGGGGLGDAAGLGEGVALGVGRERAEGDGDEGDNRRALDDGAKTGREGQLPAKCAQNAAEYGSYKWHWFPNWRDWRKL